ncbi:MAG TPA: cupin domain-containing protein [Methylocella sp.]|nr:cupin domain-containing protein [Methylocella sp.]
MNDSDEDIDAALFACGAMTLEERCAADEKLKFDSTFAQKVSEWEQALAPIALSVTPLAPPEALLEKIEERLAGRAQMEKISRTLRAAEGIWLEMGPGIRFKVLHRNLEQRRQTILLEADSRAMLPPHAHEHDEEIYMISGDLTIEGEELGPGDFHFSPKGSRHPGETTRQGCRCIITTGF